MLVLANFGRRGNLLIGGVPVGRELEVLHHKREVQETQREQGSVIVILATDAPLDARQLGHLTRRVPLGLARTGTTGGHGSRDLAICVLDREPHSPRRDTAHTSQGTPLSSLCIKAGVFRGRGLMMSGSQTSHG